MKTSRAVLIFWAGLIVLLLLIEFAEITRFFTLPIASVVGNTVAFVVGLVFTTILALVGAIFIGIYISVRLQSPSGFTPFEEEMLRMRSEVASLQQEIVQLRRSLERGSAADPPEETDGQ